MEDPNFEIGDIVQKRNLVGLVRCKSKAKPDHDKYSYQIFFGEPVELYNLEEMVYFNSKRYTQVDVDKLPTLIKAEINRCKQLYSNLSITPDSVDYNKFTKIGHTDLPKVKFNIGDRVVTKKTGPINIGSICGWCYSDEYILDYYTWRKLYPQLDELPIYFIQLDKENYNLTYEEFYELTFTKWLYGNQIQNVNSAVRYCCESVEGFQTCLETEARYFYENLPKTYTLCAPEEDLELI